MGLDSFDSGENTGGGRSNPYTDDELLDALREFYEENGQFTSKEYEEKKSNPSYSTIKRRFGTFNDAKIEAGIPVIKSGGKQTNISEEMKKVSRDKAFIVGCVLTDGWVHISNSSAHIGFQVNNKNLAQEFGLCLSSWAGLKWDGWNSGKTEMEASGPLEKNGEKAWRIKKGNEKLADHINIYTNMEAEQLCNNFLEHSSVLLSSMWDCDGSIIKNGQIRFANSDPEILKLYMLLLQEKIGVEYNDEWRWASGEKKYRKYGEFTVSTRIGESKTRNIIIPKEYNKDFANVVDSFIDKKRQRLKKWE